jgi:hypothetical protein
MPAINQSQECIPSKHASLLSQMFCQPSLVQISDNSFFCLRIPWFSLLNNIINERIYGLDDKHFAIVHEFMPSFYVYRFLQLFLFRLYNWKTNKRLRHLGATSVRRYGVWPTLERPTFIFELNTSAELYAHSYLIGIDEHFVLRAIRCLLKIWTGCDIGIAAVITIGKRI